MSAVQEQNLEPTTTPKPTQCEKCGSKAVAKPRKALLCGACILDTVQTSFYKAVCAARCNNPRERVMLALSGGPASTLAMHLAHRCLHVGEKRMQFKFCVAHVDLGGVLGLSKEQRAANLDQVKELTARYDFELAIVSLDSAFGEQTPSSNAAEAGGAGGAGGVAAVTDTPLCAAALASCNKIDAKMHVLEIVRNRALQAQADAMGCAWIMYGDTATRLASRIISDSALGSGGALPLLVSSFGKVTEDCVTRLRPLRGVLANEVALSLRSTGVLCPNLPDIDTLTPVRSSVHRLSEAFIHRLQANKDTTVHTVLRSVDKLSCRSGEGVSACAVCLTPISVTATFPAQPDGDVPVCYPCRTMVPAATRHGLAVKATNTAP